MGKFEIILWDVDQTLLDFDKSQDYALRHAFGQFGRQIDAGIISRYAAINDSYWKRLEKGEIGKKEVLTGRFQTLFEALSISDIGAEEFGAVYQKALGSVYFYKENSLKLCKELSKEFRQYAVTNGVTWTQQNKLKLSGFDKVLDGIFISEELGCPKPYKEFFDKCFEKIPNFKKEKTILVGDSLTSDMTGGNRAGIACCWYHPENAAPCEDTGLRIDFEITSLWEIKKILYS